MGFDTLVLSGGSVQGIKILGALQYCIENRFIVKIENYIGTSIGAIIGYLLAIGYSPMDIIVYICTNQILEKLQSFNLVSMTQGNGATSFHTIQEQLEEMTIAKIGEFLTLEELKKRYGATLICTTYNVSKHSVEYLGPDTEPKMPCIVALRMSANLPLVFGNYKYRDSFYVDGGLGDNFPIHIGEKIGSKVLGITIQAYNESKEHNPDDNILEFIYELMLVPMAEATEYKIANCSEKCVILQLKRENIRVFDFDISSKQKLDMFTSGFQQAKREILFE